MAREADPDDWKQLPVLFGAYFHQDWNDEFATPVAAVECFLKGTGESDIRETLVELRTFRHATVPRDLPTALWRLGSYHCSLVPGYEAQAFAKESDPERAREEHSQQAARWLDELCAVFEQAVAQQDARPGDP